MSKEIVHQSLAIVSIVLCVAMFIAGGWLSRQPKEEREAVGCLVLCAASLLLVALVFWYNLLPDKLLR